MAITAVRDSAWLTAILRRIRATPT
jgi:hypothetical protein